MKSKDNQCSSPSDYLKHWINMLNVGKRTTWTIIAFLMFLTAGLIVSKEIPIPNITSLHDIWIPIELLNLTTLANQTLVNSTSEKTPLPQKLHQRVKKKTKKKKIAEPQPQHPTTPALPRAEALRTSSRTPLENQMALFSVDSWMGNLSELPQPRVEELKALAAASMRNHEKIHPPPSRLASSRSDSIQQIKNKKEPGTGESIVDEHQIDAHDEGEGDEHDSGEFPHDDEITASLGSSHPPVCAGFHKFYCDSADDYPSALINQVTKYLKWPLEKLFRDLRGLHPPTLADSDNGNLVCDSITKIIRPGWARNTNGKWLVVINTPYHIQTVTEIKCRSESSPCGYIAPCFHSSCQQRYNIQSLLVIDPNNHYKGPFLSQFLFPSSCVCYVPDPKVVMQAQCQAAAKYGL